MQNPTELAPTEATERYEFLDVLRGVALIGIISANMISYSRYLDLADPVKAAMGTHAIDRVLDFLELLLIEGKFYSIFSVLFGIGFSILLSRAGAKGIVFHRFFLRRVFLLFVIGAAHAVFFWHNDILEAYAFCGALLLPMASARNRTILAVAAMALVAPLAIKAAGGFQTEIFTAPQNALYARFGLSADTAVDTWAHGSVGDIVRLNLCKWFGQVSFVITSGMLLRIYGCFLLGLCIGRNEVYKKLDTYRPILRRVATGGIAIGLPLNLVYAATIDSGSWTEVLSGTFGILPLSAGYACLCALTWLDGEGRKRLGPFAAVGRMALTNYVGQSVICAFLFYGPGLGLAGTMGPTLYLPIGLAVYGVQILASRWWLDRFRFGPLEWLWRMLTYGEWIRLPKRMEARLP